MLRSMSQLVHGLAQIVEADEDDRIELFFDLVRTRHFVCFVCSGIEADTQLDTITCSMTKMVMGS